MTDSQSDIRPPFPAGVNCAVLPQTGGSQLAITVRPGPGEGIAEIFARLAAAVEER